jgi:quinolinate synthase
MDTDSATPTGAGSAFAAYKNSLRDDLALEAQAKQEIIAEILRLKRERDVLILAHNYMSPLVFNLSDREYRGDSLALSMTAARTDKATILFNGVYFMAETAKILNPEKTVLIADREAGCSLADAVTGANVRRLKGLHPGAPVVTYINSYAEIKAESDICCTSANALDIIRSLASPKVIFLPDSLMGANLQEELARQGDDIELVYPGRNNDLPPGKCEVHDQIQLDDVRRIRTQFDIPRGHPRRAVLVHWECRPEVVKEADVCGSTSEMARYIRDRQPERVFLGTECEMAANLENEFPQTEFIRLCNVYCEHMARIQPEKILAALSSQGDEYQVTLDEKLRERALAPIQRMLDLSSRKEAAGGSR